LKLILHRPFFMSLAMDPRIADGERGLFRRGTKNGEIIGGKTAILMPSGDDQDAQVLSGMAQRGEQSVHIIGVAREGIAE
jgi:phosphohistidine phosphatase SixA